MGLQRSITVGHMNEASVEDRLRINSGSVLINSNSYFDPAYVPKQDWRPLTNDELEIVTRAKESPLGAERVLLGRIPESVEKHFIWFKRSILAYNDIELVRRIFLTPAFVSGRNLFSGWLRDCLGKNYLSILGNFCSNPGLVSTSVGANEKYVGLHIDSWIHGDVSSRKTGFPMRICLNLGPESRKLQMLNISVRDILRTLSDDSLTHESEDVNCVCHEFLSTHTSYPLLEIEIKPGEFYIAPTEFMIHDATTIGKKYVDALTTFLGDFDFDAECRMKNSAEYVGASSACAA